MKKVMLVLAAIVVGVLITLVTALVNVTPPNLVGATWYGLPVAWYFVIIVPGRPVHIDWLNLIGDIAFWSILVLIVLALVYRKQLRTKPAA